MMNDNKRKRRVRHIASEDSAIERLTPGELREILKKFEPSGGLYKFRATSIYHSVTYSYRLCLQESHSKSWQQPQQ